MLSSQTSNNRKWTRLAALMLPAIIVIIGMAAGFQILQARALGVLTVEISAGYNLVVDSNVSSPSTYGPAVATVAGTFCNNGDEALTDVYGYIGDYTGSGTYLGTPGTYPTRSSDSGGPFDDQHPHLAGSGTYAFQHLGGGLGTDDAIRYIGALNPGECRVQYWHFKYPQCENSGGAFNPPMCEAGTDPVWGVTRDPNDDLWLTFDIWGASAEGSTGSVSHTMTMRNEISAMANKIEPNPLGSWFNTNANTVRPGDVITSNGVRYELGNINKGFDNDGDYVYDYNAWMQPIGDAAYDPSCFRLIRTTGVVTVSRSGGLPDMIIPFTDQLYFTNLPVENNGAIGNVYYTFLALGGPCSTTMTPYQEVASGADNEKFNADFGAGIPPVVSSSPEVTLTKSSDPNIVPLGTTYTYRMVFANPSDADAGLSLSSGFGVSAPLMVADTVPDGLEYIGGSATYSLSFAGTVTIRYSTDGGATWSETDPGTLESTAANPVVIQWWLDQTLPAHTTGVGNFAEFDARAPVTYTGDPVVENCAQASFGDSTPFTESCAPTLIEGTLTIGDFVWRDENVNGLQDDGATGIPAVHVWLYWDDGDSILDADDILLKETDTDGSGAYSFTDMPNGTHYLVVVDKLDSSLPQGYRPTTPYQVMVTLSGSNVLTADFGFGPALKTTKERISTSPVNPGDSVTFQIGLENLLPGSGSSVRACQYRTWSTAEDAAHSGAAGGGAAFQSISNIYGPPNNTYAVSPLASNSEVLAVTGFNLGTHPGTITKVEVLLPVDFLPAIAGTLQVKVLRVSDGVEMYTGALEDISTFTKATRTYTIWQTGDPASVLSDWAAYTGSLYSIQLTSKKSGNPSGDLLVDAAGFRITSDQTGCGSLEEDITYLPLTDTYNSSELQYLSASPAPDSVAAGTLTWNNLGTLYAGGTKTVTVNFRALRAANPSTNYADVNNAAFGDGRLTNDPPVVNATVVINMVGSIGDRVWYDMNGNTADDSEPGINGVTVRLCGTLNNCTGGNLLATTTTDTTGAYKFSALASGTYYVWVTDPGGYTRTYDPQGAADSKAQVVLTLTGDPANDNITTIDFGYDNGANGAVKGYVWYDANTNATMDTNESGISGVTVELCRGTAPTCTTSLGTTTTAANGYYQFSTVPANTNYFVRVTAPAAYPVQTADPDVAGVCGVGCNNYTANFDVSADQTKGPYNFGYRQNGSSTIGDTIYKDWNGDGSQNLTTEEGISGVTVRLYRDLDGSGNVDSADLLMGTQTTGASGDYLFTGLEAATYIVQVDRTAIPPASYNQTQDPGETGVCSVCDSQSLRAADGTSPYLNEDFGYKPTGFGSIGDFVWRDLDADTNQDAGEAGIPEITVWLYENSNGGGLDASDALIATTETDADGLYLFDGLPAGDYIVVVDTADGQLPTGSNGLTYVLSTANSPLTVNLPTATTDYTSADFGFAPSGLIGDFVWQDNDGDGTQDTSEPGLAAVRVYLCASSPCNAGTALQYDDTDSSGKYEFTGLAADDYVIAVDSATLPSGAVQTYDPDEPNGDLPCTVCDHQAAITLQPGQVNRTVDFGYRPLGVIGDTLWIDANDNDSRDDGEAGVAGVTVRLLNGGGSEIASTTTDSDGYYSFGNLSGGDYTVVVVSASLPAGLSQTYDPDGSLDNQSTITLPAGGSNFGLDFGYRFEGARIISGTVFNDERYNGGLYTPADGDQPYEGVIVYLWKGSVLVGTTTTDPTGFYQFTGLTAADDYVVSTNKNAPIYNESHPTNPTPNTIRYVDISVSDQPNQDFGFGGVDYGDLPGMEPFDYANTLDSDNGARHTIGDLFLGAGVDSDPDGTESNTAEGDTRDDGVLRASGQNWIPDTDVNLIVDVEGSGGYLVGWFDWNGNGSLADSGEMVEFGAVISGTQSLPLHISADYTLQQPLNVRFRLYDGDPGAPTTTGLALNGEVEDYRWLFGPTVVRLENLAVKAGSGSTVFWLGSIALVGLMTGLCGLAVSYKRRAR